MIVLSIFLRVAVTVKGRGQVQASVPEASLGGGTSSANESSESIPIAGDQCTFRGL